MVAAATAALDRTVMTPHRMVTTPELSRPVGYAHAVIAAPGRLLHLGGHTAQDADGVVRGDIVAQLDAALRNVCATLRAAGSQPDHVVSMVMYLTDMDAYRAARPALGPVWQRHFGRQYPALAAVEVSQLFDPGALVELMAVAVIP